MSIYVVSDIHGKWGVIENFLDKVPEGSTLIQLGDFGLGFQPYEQTVRSLTFLDEKLEDKDCKLLAIRGNHDEPCWWQDEKQNEKINSEFFRIEFIPDYTYREIGGKMFLFIGGAISIDRGIRTLGRDLWEGEEFEFIPEKVDKNFDVLITHGGGAISLPIVGGKTQYFSKVGDDPELFEDLRKDRMDFLALASLAVERGCKIHYYGHYHMNECSEGGGMVCFCTDQNECRELILV